MPRSIARALTRYRHGPGVFKVEFAIEGGVPWSYEPASRAGTVHVGGGLREITAGEKALHGGRMPDSPFVLVCQQYLADPSRSAGDVHPVYSYAHVPAGYAGDATAAITLAISGTNILVQVAGPTGVSAGVHDCWGVAWNLVD